MFLVFQQLHLLVRFATTFFALFLKSGETVKVSLDEDLHCPRGGGKVVRGFLLPVYNVIIYGHHVCRVDIAIVIDVRSFAVEAGCTAIRDETVHCGYIGSVDIAIVIQILFRKFHDILEFFPAIKPLNFFFAAVEDIKCSCVVNIFLETVIVNTKRILGQILDGCQSRAFIETPFSYARHGVRDGY